MADTGDATVLGTGSLCLAGVAAGAGVGGVEVLADVGFDTVVLGAVGVLGVLVVLVVGSLLLVVVTLVLAGVAGGVAAAAVDGAITDPVALGAGEGEAVWDFAAIVTGVEDLLLLLPPPPL